MIYLAEKDFLHDIVSFRHADTHHGDHGVLWLEVMFLQHRSERVMQRLTGLHHDPHRLTSWGNLQPETHMHFKNLVHTR